MWSWRLVTHILYYTIKEVLAKFKDFLLHFLQLNQTLNKWCARPSAFVWPVGMLSLWNDLWLAKVSHHGQDFLKPKNMAYMGGAEIEVFSLKLRFLAGPGRDMGMSVTDWLTDWAYLLGEHSLSSRSSSGLLNNTRALQSALSKLERGEFRLCSTSQSFCPLCVPGVTVFCQKHGSSTQQWTEKTFCAGVWMTPDNTRCCRFIFRHFPQPN